MKKVAVLISGGGSNLRNLAEICQKKLKNKCQIVIVVSSVESAKGLEIAAENGIKTTVLPDLTAKVSVISGNIEDYNKFADLRLKSEVAFAEIKKHLEEKAFEYSLFNLIQDALAKISSLSDFPEEDIKEDVLTDVFFEAFTREKETISEAEEEKILSQIDDILYGIIDEIKVIATLFITIKKRPEFLKFFAREKYDEILHNILSKEGVDFILLAGFMRILTPSFTAKWENKILNIHPSLLPSFGGAKAVKEALNYGVKITGCTVHFVGSGVDNGKIILQKAVEISPEDTEESLHEKIKLAEKEIYPKALELLIENKI